MTSEEFNKINWSQFFMAAAVGLVMIIQAWHGVEIESAHEKADAANAKIVPRVEYERRHLSKMSVEDAMRKEEIQVEIKSLHERLMLLEATNANK